MFVSVTIYIFILVWSSVSSTFCSQPLCDTPGHGKVLIVTGFPKSLNSEVIDLNSDDTVCEEVGDFPLQIDSSVGILLGNYPVICGGYDYDTYELSNKCYKLDETKQYHEFATMQKPRMYAGTISHEDKMWITGGEDEIGTELKTTEFILASGNSTPGPDLPIALEKHAMAKVDLSISMIIGGYSYDNDLTYDKTWYFEHHTEKFSDGPRLLEERCDHTAGVIKDSVFTDEKRVVVVGGSNNGKPLKSVEWLVSGTWEQGPELPIPLAWHEMIEYGNDLFVIGGYSEGGSYSKSIYRLSCALWSCNWTEMKQNLSFGRVDFVAIPLPDSIVTCK